MDGRQAYIGVDVGTGSARAGVFDDQGELIASARRPIKIWREAGEIVEQSSHDIWSAVCAATREAVRLSGLSAQAFKGLGFDATCSLVALDAALRPVSVSPTGAAERNVIVWMDHRATQESREINSGRHSVLRYVGGRLSPEMQTPKLLWLKRHLPDSFARAAHFFDLTDFLTFRSTGAFDRSICTVTCKTTYLAHEGRWDAEYFRAIGLEELAQDGFARLGAKVSAPGAPLGVGLSQEAAEAMGLPAGVAVGVGLIDAHAGALATIGAADSSGAADPKRRLALILGTSSCCMAVSDEPRFVEGVWGPYFSAVTPDQWLVEGGQSAFGAAIDHLVRLHPAFAALEAQAGEGALGALEREVVARAGGLSEAATLARDLHVSPDFLGNRSPFADPRMRGAIVGLDLREDRESLGELYVAGLVGLAIGLGQIIESLEAGGFDFDEIVVSGGAANSALVRQIIADATGKSVCAAQTSEAVLLGAAMLGAVAAGAATMASAMSAMSRLGERHAPADGTVAAFHARKRRAFAKLQRAEQDVRAAAAPAPRRAGGAWPKLVIFDCDGVLVDSEGIAQDVTARALRKVGLDFTPAEIRRRYLGLRFDAFQRDVEAEIGRPLPPGFRGGEARAMLSALRRGLHPILGIEEALAGLSAPICVASSSPMERVRVSLRLTGLDAHFSPHVFSADDVPRGKPAPDIFLHAARAMRVSPEDCLVIEDSVAGITAARAAGMRAFGFAGGSHFVEEGQRRALGAAGAEETFTTMADLPKLVEKAGNRRHGA